MKKFKTKRNHPKIIYLIITMVLLIIFIILSFIELNSSNQKLVIFLTKQFNNKESVSINILTSNLDNLINTYNFKEKNIVYKENINKIYLYNTHNLENYQDNTSITKATKLLSDNLQKLGINTIIENNMSSDLLHTGLSYYDISRSFLKDVMNKENNIAYYIDIHRDSVNNTTITINNKKYAQIMFVLGLENENYQSNKLVIEEMNNYLNKNYPGLSRGIYEKKGRGVDGVYNQDLNSNVILIEIGGIENNLEEVNNSTEIIALMLYYMLGD